MDRFIPLIFQKKVDKAVAKSIIDAHEGKINLESDLGKGTSIEIELPCEESV